MAKPDPKAVAALILQVAGSLMAPGAPYEIGVAKVRGNDLRVYIRQPQALPEWYATQFPKFHKDTFIVFQEERYTFGQVEQLTARLSHYLVHTLKVKPGDRVGICMRNYPEWCIAFFAATAIGAIGVPLNSWWTQQELEYGLSDSGTRVLVCDEQIWTRASAAIQKLGVKTILTRLRSGAAPPKGVILWSDVVGGKEDVKAIYHRVHPEDVALIMYTSGTTGHPKGVVLTHRSVMAQMHQAHFGSDLMAKLAPPDPNQHCVICPIPMFHVTGSHHIFLASLVQGRKLVLMFKWDAGDALALIEKEKATAWTGVPTMMQDLMEHKDFPKRDVSSLKVVGGGGAAVPVPQVQRVEKAFKGVGRPGQGYGLTETNGGIASITGDAFLLKPGSTGPPGPVTDVKVVDLATRKELPTGQAGELLIRGPLVMKEYWGKPEATAQVLDKEGWFASGDVAKLDEEKCIFITDRAKEIIIRGGENISCAEVEAAFYKHPAVYECAVFGLPDERLGEVVGLFVLLKPNAKATGAELVHSVKGDLAGFKIPLAENVFFTQEGLPRGDTGKILRRAIKEKIVKQKKEGSPKSKL